MHIPSSVGHWSMQSYWWVNIWFDTIAHESVELLLSHTHTHTTHLLNDHDRAFTNTHDRLIVTRVFDGNEESLFHFIHPYRHIYEITGNDLQAAEQRKPFTFFPVHSTLISKQIYTRYIHFLCTTKSKSPLFLLWKQNRTYFIHRDRLARAHTRTRSQTNSNPPAPSTTHNWSENLQNNRSTLH